MTYERLIRILELMRWSRRDLAWICNVHERQVRRWPVTVEIPPAIAAWLERVVAPLEAEPFPPGRPSRDLKDISEPL